MGAIGLSFAVIYSAFKPSLCPDVNSHSSSSSVPWPPRAVSTYRFSKSRFDLLAIIKINVSKLVIVSFVLKETARY